MPTVRLEYGGMRFENTAAAGDVVATITHMADKHQISIGEIRPMQLIAATGRARVTRNRATFKVLGGDK